MTRPLLTLIVTLLLATTGMSQPQRQGGRSRFGGPGFAGENSSGTKLKPSELEFKDGVASIPDHATYHKLSYRGPEVMIDTFLANLEFVKFTIDDANTDDPQLYFINTKTHRAHMMFARAAGLPGGREEAIVR